MYKLHEIRAAYTAAQDAIGKLMPMISDSDTLIDAMISDFDTLIDMCDTLDDMYTKHKAIVMEGKNEK